MRRCTAITSKGDECRNLAMSYSQNCYSHARSPHVWDQKVAKLVQKALKLASHMRRGDKG